MTHPPKGSNNEYVMKMRARINKPTCWTDVLNVKYSDNRTIVGGYMSTEPDLAGGTRGTAYAYKDFDLTADTLTINGIQQLAMFIDEADRYQQTYVNQMEIADYQGKKTIEKLESLTLAQHGSWKDFGVTDLANTGADDTATITVSAANIDDLIRAIKRKLYFNNGVEFAVEKGIFIVWRAADFELLEAKLYKGLVKLSLIKSKVQKWITNTKQALAVQVKRLSEKEPIFGYATVWTRA